MGIFNNCIEINKENPFEKDEICREDEIKNLTKLFEIVDNQMVLAINSPWGTGKTTFLKMWEAYLGWDIELSNKYEVIYFNAWENDDCLDPLVAIIAEMKDSIERVNKTDWDNIKLKGKKLAKKIAPAATKIITAGLISSSDINLGEKIEDTIIDVSGNLFNIDRYIEQKEIRKEFEKDLEKYQKKLDKTVVFFIDELDRCKPTFAIETLERIKHLFNLEKFIFVLGIDKEALSNSIKVIYGSGTDVNGYLTRFIDVEYSLKETYRGFYIRHLMDKYTVNKIDFGGSNRNFFDVMEIIDLFGLSLRDMEKVVASLYLISKENKELYTKLDCHIISILLMIKKTDKSLYSKVKDRRIDSGQLIEALDEKIHIKKWFDENKKRYAIKGNIINILCDIDMYNVLRNKLNELNKSNKEKNSDEIDKCKICLDECELLENKAYKKHMENKLEYITNIIDFYSNLDITQ